MLNRRNNNNFIKINKYNKFLSTLDNKSNVLNLSNNKLNNEPDETNKTDKPDETDKHDETDNAKNKKQIDNIILSIDTNFLYKKLSSSNFNGQHKFNSTINNQNDPNIYDDLLINSNSYLKHKQFFSKFLNQKNEPYEPYEPIKKSRQPVQPNKEIHIDANIQNINDLIILINTYKADSNIKYNINMTALHNIKDPLTELNNMIGMNELKTNIVDQILYFIQDLHKNNNISENTLLSGDFMHTVIYGPPGTGKTEIAKILGKIYSNIGLLKKGVFKKVTRSDLVAGYLGQTALKTRDVITSCLGGVLFIDEAYALGNTDKDSFSKECIDTLCEALSDNKDNLMVIIAGYEKELNDCFFNCNQGLDSRFTWRFKTDDYNYEDLYKIFVKKVKEIGWDLDTNSITAEWFKKNKDYFKFYGRDIESIVSKTKIAHSKRIFGKAEIEKKKINIQDLNKGFEIFLKNNNVKGRLEEEHLKKQLYSSLYC